MSEDPKIRPSQPGSAKCWDEGVAARQAGKGREECPYSDYQRPQQRAWLGGWDSSAPQPRVAIPPPTQKRRSPPPERAGEFAPKGEDLQKQVYRRPPRAVVACPKCRRRLTKHGGQAVIVIGIHAGKANLRCRACDHPFTLPVALDP